MMDYRCNGTFGDCNFSRFGYIVRTDKYRDSQAGYFSGFRIWVCDSRVSQLMGVVKQFLSRVSTLTRDIGIAILSVRLSVRDTLVLYENGLTYRHSFFHAQSF